MTKDPVCGMMIEEDKAVASQEYQGRTYYFCSHTCKTTFAENPARFADTGQGGDR